MQLHELAGHHVRIPETIPFNIAPILAGQPLIDRVNASFARNLARFQDIADQNSDRGPIAICGAGPSLNDFVPQILGFEAVMVCGTAHDHAVSLGVFPYYAVVFDPQPLCARYLTAPKDYCTYLVASICDPATFDALAGQDVRVWHPAGSVDMEHYRGEMAVTGGSAVTLRAMVLAFLLGHREQHIFGFDCCFSDKTHAFGSPAIAAALTIKFNGREFLTTLQLIEQAQELVRSVQLYGDQFHPIVYGNGLAAEMLKSHRGE